MSDGPAASPAKLVSRRRRRRSRLRFVLYLLVVYSAWCATLYFAQDSLLFPADMAPPPLPSGRFDATTIVLERGLDKGGKVIAWLLPSAGATAAKPAPLVVFFHGNAEIIDYQDDIVTNYRRMGCSVLLPEYRGYGRSGGRPSQRGILEDAAWFLDQALKRPDVDKNRVVLHGRSLGGGPAALLAEQRPPQALILQSTFSSVAVMAHGYFAPEFLVSNPFRVDRALRGLDLPVLIFHGTGDDIIPVWHGRELAKAARRGTYVEYDCMHNDFPGAGRDEEFWLAIRRFLAANRIVDEEHSP